MGIDTTEGGSETTPYACHGKEGSAGAIQLNRVKRKDAKTLRSEQSWNGDCEINVERGRLPAIARSDRLRSVYSLPTTRYTLLDRMDCRVDRQTGLFAMTGIRSRARSVTRSSSGYRAIPSSPLRSRT
jgi:hypothetical protein